MILVISPTTALGSTVLLVMLIALAPALIAKSKGRSAFGWWIYGMLLFIVALPHALLLAERRPDDRHGTRDRRAEATPPGIPHWFSNPSAPAEAQYRSVRAESEWR
jgi:hypothetical protein